MFWPLFLINIYNFHFKITKSLYFCSKCGLNVSGSFLNSNKKEIYVIFVHVPNSKTPKCINSSTTDVSSWVDLQMLLNMRICWYDAYTDVRFYLQICYQFFFFCFKLTMDIGLDLGWISNNIYYTMMYVFIVNWFICVLSPPHILLQIVIVLKNEMQK